MKRSPRSFQSPFKGFSFCRCPPVYQNYRSSAHNTRAMICKTQLPAGNSTFVPKRFCRVHCSSASRSRELPGGTFWLPKESTNHDVLYGQDFVLQRPKIGGPGLVLSMEGSSLSHKPIAPSALTVRSAAGCGPPTPQSSIWDVTDITDYSFLGESGLLPGKRTPFLLPGSSITVSLPENTQCTGIILHPSIDRQPEEQPGPDKNPRRTKKVKFTCKLCETVSVKRVSPHGWTAGSVFARCEGCGVVHKLVDNLKIFHEFKGSVFSRRAPSNVKIPSGLPQKPGLDYHMHPTIYQQTPHDD